MEHRLPRSRVESQKYGENWNFWRLCRLFTVVVIRVASSLSHNQPPAGGTPNSKATGLHSRPVPGGVGAVASSGWRLRAAACAGANPHHAAAWPALRPAARMQSSAHASELVTRSAVCAARPHPKFRPTASAEPQVAADAPHQPARWRTPTVTVPRISGSEPCPNQIGGVMPSVATSDTRGGLQWQLADWAATDLAGRSKDVNEHHNHPGTCCTIKAVLVFF